MARMRVVKAELWTDRITGAWPSEVRDLYLALTVQADDHGRFENDPVSIRAAVYPRRPDVTEAQIVEWVERMRVDGRLATYTTSSGNFGVVLRFYKHQRPQRRFAPRYPAPPMDILTQITSLNESLTPPEHTHACEMAHRAMVRGMGYGDSGSGSEKGGKECASLSKTGAESGGSGIDRRAALLALVKDNPPVPEKRSGASS